MSEESNDVTCRYCQRELPFKEAKEYHEHLHETNAWERAYNRGARQ